MEYRYAVETVDTEPAWYQRFVYGGPEPYDVQPGLSATQVRVVSAHAVDLLYDRWNGSFDPQNCTRRASAIELEAMTRDRRGEAITVADFFGLFTRAERIAMRQLARGDCTATPPVPPDEEIADYLHMMELRAASQGTIRVRSARIVAALDLLIARGIIVPSRKIAILRGEDQG